MACLDENDVVAFLARTLSNERITELEAHLADCRDCRELIAASADGRPREATQPIDEDPAGAAAPSNLASRLSLAQAMARVGTTLCGKWTIDGFIGAGGMAHVFSGVHRNGRRVAVKILRPELAREPELVRRFHREGYVANRVEHEGAVAVLDDDTAEDGAPFLVMELLEGETLKTRIGRAGPLPLGEGLRLADECLAVLAAAHARGVVHRDIKPDNLFLTESGHIKVLDFGIARLRESTQPLEAQTRAGQMIGTPGYMAPEQARGRTEDVDARTDVWSLGATFFAMFAGRPLQRADTVQELLALAITTPAPPTSQTSPLVPAPVGRVLDKALSFDAADRFADAAAMRVALRDAAQQTGSGTVSAPVTSATEALTDEGPRARRVGPWVVGLALIGAGSAFWLAQGVPQASTSTPTATSTASSTATATATSTSTSTSTATSTATSTSGATATSTSGATDAGAPVLAQKKPKVPAVSPTPADAAPAPVERDPLGPRR